MALVTCSECKKEVSSSAKVCPQCGAKLKMGVFAKTLIGAAVVAGALLLFAAMIPEDVAKAQSLRSICEREMMPIGMATQYDCNKMYRDAKNAKK